MASTDVELLHTGLRMDVIKEEEYLVNVTTSHCPDKDTEHQVTSTDREDELAIPEESNHDSTPNNSSLSIVTPLESCNDAINHLENERHEEDTISNKQDDESHTSETETETEPPVEDPFLLEPPVDHSIQIPFSLDLEVDTPSTDFIPPHPTPLLPPADHLTTTTDITTTPIPPEDSPPSLPPLLPPVVSAPTLTSLSAPVVPPRPARPSRPARSNLSPSPSSSPPTKQRISGGIIPSPNAISSSPNTIPTLSSLNTTPSPNTTSSPISEEATAETSTMSDIPTSEGPRLVNPRRPARKGVKPPTRGAPVAFKLTTKTDTSDIKGPAPLNLAPPAVNLAPPAASNPSSHLSSSDGVIPPPRSGSPNLVARPGGMPNFAAQALNVQLKKTAAVKPKMETSASGPIPPPKPPSPSPPPVPPRSVGRVTRAHTIAEVSVVKKDEGKQGYLLKRGGIFKGWKRRWFVLKDGKLYYYRSQKTDTPKGVIADVYKVDKHPKESPKDKDFCFNLYSPKRTYHCSADSSSDLESWLEKISAILVTKPS